MKLINRLLNIIFPFKLTITNKKLHKNSSYNTLLGKNIRKTSTNTILTEKQDKIYNYNKLFLKLLKSKKAIKNNSIYEAKKNMIYPLKKSEKEPFKIRLKNLFSFNKAKQLKFDLNIKNDEKKQKKSLLSKIIFKAKNNTFVSYSPKYIWKRIRNRLKGLGLEELEG